MIKLILPYPPTINTYYATVGGRRVLSKKGRLYKRSVVSSAQNCGYKVGFNVLMARIFNSIISVDVTLFVPDRRKRDVDNVMKPLLDSLMYAGFINDDSQVHKLIIEKSDYDKDNKNYCVVIIEEMQ